MCLRLWGRTAAGSALTEPCRRPGKARYGLRSSYPDPFTEAEDARRWSSAPLSRARSDAALPRLVCRCSRLSSSPRPWARRSPMLCSAARSRSSIAAVRSGCSAARSCRSETSPSRSNSSTRSSSSHSISFQRPSIRENARVSPVLSERLYPWSNSHGHEAAQRVIAIAAQAGIRGRQGDGRAATSRPRARRTRGRRRAPQGPSGRAAGPLRCTGSGPHPWIPACAATTRCATEVLKRP